MAQTIKIKRSTVTSVPSSLAQGELAYSALSNKLFIGRPGGTSGDVDAIGGKHYVDIIDNATTSATADTLVLRDGDGFISGTFLGNADTATTLETARTITLSGDVIGAITFDGSQNVTMDTAIQPNSIALGTDTTGNYIATVADVGNTNISVSGSGSEGGAVTLDLTTTGVTADSYGSATEIPNFTVDSYGRITAAGTTAISTSLTVSDGTDTDTVALGTDTLSVLGGTGVTSEVTDNTVTLSIGQDVSTTADVTFNDVTVDGSLSSDDITAATMTASGNVIVQGNLTVNGTTTSVNSNTVSVGDNIIVLNGDETGTPSQNGGIEIERGTSDNVSLRWNETTDFWQVTADGTNYSNLLTVANFESQISTLDGGTF